MAQMTAGQSSYSKKEEFLNSISHGLGALLTIPATLLLVHKALARGTTTELVSYIIFGISMFCLYAASTIYHAWPTHKIILKKLDHSSIFLMIAGTYTPVALIAIGGKSGWIVFFVEWGLALCGILFKMYFVHRFARLSLLIYLGMGWLAIVFYQPMLDYITMNGFLLLLAGGLCYTIGTYFYRNKKIPYNHAIWHVFVMGGSLFMYLTIYLYM
ncbi:PAQR family membrane homeostasis protein TrhA [Ureibacillus sinduriensis]|uniref:Hemolysin D n=1 Tax=Ureibacillus sinduriensis BLB-1 = JCM 15800 TaxID=1384057 RepID=A0A0A3IHS4_9BACL|nr:hemolysin III family protein [Ureibacillus sinduriensis]KGR74407.1 hemolysin D [Ureibacillus sinduriensis BLB-1 = JCM 15800]